MNIYDKITNNIATLADQEEALKDTYYSYCFAKLNIPGTDVKKCQEAVCKKIYYAYYFAKYIPGADIEYCRKACESDSEWLKAFDKMIVEKVLK